MSDRGTDACKAHLGSCSKIDIRQTRRGWCQELFCGCEARNEFKYFVNDGNNDNQIAHSLEESACLARCCCQPCYSYKMPVAELNTNAEILTVDRPCRLCVCACKCCCYQEATITSGGQVMGSIKETCYYCVPSFHVNDADGKHIFTVHPPTCCGGMCFNCCTEGNPCGKGCCKMPFWIFPAAQTKTNGGDAEYIGKILKKPKSAMTEAFTDANAFEVTFPDNATVEQKATLVGSSIFFNAIFFEGDN